MSQIIDLFLHLDTHLASVISQYGTFTYVILFLIIFCETGLVIMPFLPGDSLLFAAGAFAAQGSLNLVFLPVLLSFAAIIGDTINYLIGREIGHRVYERNFRLIKREYLDRTKAFYERHGGKTIIFARYMPIIRTFAPFVAGAAKMNYSTFLSYNIIGGIAWVLLMTCAGYLFGNIPIVQENFEIVIFGIIFVSILPGIIGWLRTKIERKVR
jgi:membrane-associated protein